MNTPQVYIITAMAVSKGFYMRLGGKLYVFPFTEYGEFERKKYSKLKVKPRRIYWKVRKMRKWYA